MSEPTNNTPASLQVEKKRPHVSSPEQVIKLLDTEIAHLKDADKRPGWTPWALLGSFGAVVWLIFSQLDSGTVNLENIPALYLAFYTTFQSLLTIYASLAPNSSRQHPSPRFQLSSSFSGYRATTLIYFSHSLLLFYVAVLGKQRPGLAQLILVSASYLLFACFALVAFVLSFFRVPLLIRPAAPAVPIIQGVLSVALLWASYGYFASVLSSPSGVGYGDYRVSILLVVAFYLFSKIVSGARETPLLESLVEIRRDFVFGRTDTETAMRRADIALAGLEVNDVLHDDISRVLTLLDQVEAEDATLIALASRHEDELKNLSTTPLSAEQIGSVDDVRESLTTHYKRIIALLDEISTTQHKIFRRGKLLTLMHPVAGKAVVELGDKLSAAYERLRVSSSKSKTKLEVMHQTRDEFVRAKRAELATIQEKEKIIVDRVSKIVTTIARREKLTREELSAVKQELNAVREDLYDMACRWPTLRTATEETLARLSRLDSEEQSLG